MPETLAALIFAHMLADFVFQTNRMVANKRHPAMLAAHLAVVLATAVAATGNPHPALVALALAHLATDAVKTFLLPKGLGAFLGDQAAHLATLGVVAALVPGLWADGLWAAFAPLTAPLPGLMAVIAGAILATRAGGFAIGLLMAPWARELDGHGGKGLTDGGQAIGLLERGLIFLLVLTGQPEGIGFLIAAKSVLRFGTVGDDRAVSEYVIIGTLASFGWAIAASFATLALTGHLPPLGIPDLSP